MLVRSANYSCLQCCTWHACNGVGGLCVVLHSAANISSSSTTARCSCLVSALRCFCRCCQTFDVGRTLYVLVCLLSVQYLLMCHVPDASVLPYSSTCLHDVLDSMHMSFALRARVSIGETWTGIVLSRRPGLSCRRVPQLRGSKLKVRAELVLDSPVKNSKLKTS